MGEIAEMMLDGTLCEGCGEVFEDIIRGGKEPGYPRRCASCQREAADEQPATTRGPVKCIACDRHFADAVRMAQHVRAKVAVEAERPNSPKKHTLAMPALIVKQP